MRIQSILQEISLNHDWCH